MRLPIRSPRAALTLAALLLFLTFTAEAAEKWIEVKSANFVVTSTASASATKTLAWQLEQIRSTIRQLWPWAQVDLDKPLAVLAVDNEPGMKALAPKYWEQKGGVRPASAWVEGVDRYYLAIRTDLEAEDRLYVNPHISAYFSYASLILRQSVQADLPEWFSRGLAGVLSNTIVRDSYVLLGPPIPWHLEALRERTRLMLPALVKVTRESPEMRSGEGLSRFDAQAWAFVHFLMFADNGTRRPKLDQFFRLVTGGTDSEVALREAIGNVAALEGDFVTYVNRSIFSYGKLTIDAAVKREGFSQRTLPTHESASLRAFLHVAMRRPVEAGAAIAEARKADAAAAESHAAEGILLDQDRKADEARAAFTRAVDGGSTNAYAHYRLAGLLWRRQPDPEALTRIEKLLTRSTELNARYAPAFGFLAETKSLLKSPDALGVVRRAIQLAPAEPDHRLTAARILWRSRNLDDALKVAQVGLALATTDEDRREARELIDAIGRDKNQ